MQKKKIWRHEKVVCAQHSIYSGEWDAQLLWDFISAKQPNLVIIDNKREHDEYWTLTQWLTIELK